MPRRLVSKRMRVIPSTLLAASILLLAGSREAHDESMPSDPTDTARASTLAASATMFAPIVAARLDGREAIIGRVAAEPIPAAVPQAQALPRLDGYDWTKWLIGEWEGWLKAPSGDSTRIRQSFEYVAAARHILTELELTGADGSSYHGAGIFSYDPVRGLSSGEWFGMFGDRNYALGRRHGDSWAWDIHRHGRQRVWRVRDRVSEDEYRVTSTSTDGEGRQRITHELMRRVGTER